jgi:2-polyprenyl-6-methoxyphenol hydroxylase-like FAD-dependent oxidoreductase
MSVSVIKTEVLVLGAGPVGLALAGDLGWRGRQCLLVEKTDGAIFQPKMDLVGIRTMEFCRRWGITQDVENSSYNRDYPQDNIYLTSLNGYELGRQPMPSMNESKPPPESPAKRERCPQNMFDPILQKFAEDQASTEILYEHELIAFTQNDNEVISTIKNLKSGEVFSIHSKYLVGCDGGRSRIREALGIEMTGKGVLTNTTNVIFECGNFNDLHDKRPGYRYMFVGPNGTWATIVAINGSNQWRMSIIGDRNDRPEYTEEDLKEFAYKALGKPFDLKIISTLRWTRSELVANQYHQGRVFIAGDACHLTSPTGGLGMNTGIGDAVDISWKIAAVLEDWGKEGLLDAYDIERRPVALRITQFSTGNLSIMKSVPTHENIDKAGSIGDEFRAKAGKALLDGLKREWFSQNMHLGNRYINSPICVYTEVESAEALKADFDDPINYQQSTKVGVRAPHAWIEPGKSTLDLFGREFVLILSHSADKNFANQFQLVANELQIPLQILVVTQESVEVVYDRPYVLVRPDGHIAWSSFEPIGNAENILKQVVGYKHE